MDIKRTDRKRGDRPDGRLIKSLDGLHSFMPYLIPNRTDAEVYLQEQMDVTELLKYLEKKNGPDADFKTTPFHLFVMAIGKTIYARPNLNRFIQGKRTYEREEITLSFVVKRVFCDNAEEMLLVTHARPETTLKDISKKILGDSEKLRREGSNDIDSILKNLAKMPRIINRFVMLMFRFLDFHGWMPKIIRDGDPNYTTVLISNLGSIKCDAPYHHLNNYGTNSVLITIGEIHKAYVVDETGTPQVRDVVNFGCTLDERIGDGFYFAKSIKFIKYLLQHPQLLEEPIESEVEYEY